MGLWPPKVSAPHSTPSISFNPIESISWAQGQAPGAHGTALSAPSKS